MTKPCNVLVVEDDPGVRELLRSVLADEGNTVAVARNGKEMQAAFDADEFNVVIIDIRLPGPENGIALARQATERGRGVVLITGDHSQAETLDGTGYRYLLKPFRVEELLEATQEVADGIQARCIIRRQGRI